MERKNKILPLERLQREVSVNRQAREQTLAKVAESRLDVAPVTGFLKLMERWHGVRWNGCVLLTFFPPHVISITLDVSFAVSVSLVTSHRCFSTR